MYVINIFKILHFDQTVRLSSFSIADCVASQKQAKMDHVWTVDTNVRFRTCTEFTQFPCNSRLYFTSAVLSMQLCMVFRCRNLLIDMRQLCGLLLAAFTADFATLHLNRFCKIWYLPRKGNLKKKLVKTHYFSLTGTVLTTVARLCCKCANISLALFRHHDFSRFNYDIMTTFYSQFNTIQHESQY